MEKQTVILDDVKTRFTQESGFVYQEQRQKRGRRGKRHVEHDKITGRGYVRFGFYLSQLHSILISVVVFPFINIRSK